MNKFTPIKISKCIHCGVTVSYSEYSDYRWFHGGGMYGYYECANDSGHKAEPEKERMTA